MVTYQTILDDARDLLQDTEAPFRYTDAVLIRILNRALRELAKLRSDAYWELYSRNSLNVPEIAEEPAGEQVSLDTNFPLDAMFYSPLVAYVVGSAEITDDEYADDGRAAMLLTKFKQDVVAV